MAEDEDASTMDNACLLRVEYLRLSRQYRGPRLCTRQRLLLYKKCTLCCDRFTKEVLSQAPLEKEELFGGQLLYVINSVNASGARTHSTTRTDRVLIYYLVQTYDNSTTNSLEFLLLQVGHFYFFKKGSNSNLSFATPRSLWSA